MSSRWRGWACRPSRPHSSLCHQAQRSEVQIPLAGTVPRKCMGRLESLLRQEHEHGLGGSPACLRCAGYGTIPPASPFQRNLGLRSYVLLCPLRIQGCCIAFFIALYKHRHLNLIPVQQTSMPLKFNEIQSILSANNFISALFIWLVVQPERYYLHYCK